MESKYVCVLSKACAQLSLSQLMHILRNDAFFVLITLPAIVCRLVDCTCECERNRITLPIHGARAKGLL